MRSPRNIFLIGFSGTGKTQSGRQAAALLGWAFVDTDDLIQERTGKEIPRIFEQDGETTFRALEAEVLNQVAERDLQVVSTGGGMPVAAENLELMKRTGLLIRLSASPETVSSRLSRSRRTRGRDLRPMLGPDAPVERVRQLLAEREPVYSQADYTIDTEGKSHEEVAREIVEAWRNFDPDANGHG